MSTYDDPDSQDYREHNLGDERVTAEEREIERLEARIAKQRKALEFAGYLAKSAEAYQRAADIMLAAYNDDEEVTDAMRDLLADHYRGLNSSIYEFRKRLP